jgi:DNA repair exonuclease SbcCD ATPase subunit
MQGIEAALSALSVRGEALKAAAAHAEQAEAERRLLVEREQGALQATSEFADRCEKQVSKLTRIRHERDAAIEQLRSNGLFAGPQTQATLNDCMTTQEKLGNLITQVSATVEASVAIAARERIAENQRALQSRQDHILREVEQADRLIKMLMQAEQQAGQQFFDRLGPAVGTLFDHMQVNRVFRNLEISAVKESFRLDGQLDDDVSLDPGSHFSQGQRQDLALSMFLVRAASLGGSFFMDEPLVHLDDMNRTALLDCLRACVLGTATSPRPVRLIVTTANWSVARHLMQKFHSVRYPGSGPSLRVIQLSGNVRHGLRQSVVFPTGDNSAEVLIH